MSPSQQRRRSGRGKGGGGNAAGAAGNAAGAAGNAGGNKKGGANKNGRAKRATDFWEVRGASPGDLAAAVTVPDDPTALVRSLGAPSLPGQGSNAEHYFIAVYEKASHVAAALATANGLLAGDEGDADDADEKTDPPPAEAAGATDSPGAT